MEEKQDIRAFTLKELTEHITSLKEKPFRARQIYQWLWQKASGSFDEMTNLPSSLTEKLNKNYLINRVRVEAFVVSKDKTIKTRFKLYDNNIIEGVLIPSRDRVTACISSQAGCSLACEFCATGLLKNKRNLTAGEIFDQVVLLKEQSIENYNLPLSNIVLMGMGEPLLNYEQVIKGIEKITSPEGLNMSSKRITLSTAGVVKMIRRLADDKVKFKLAVSLHAADDDMRSKIIPVNKQNSLSDLMDALNYFYNATRSRITFEYILFDKLNDTTEDAIKLLALCRKVPCKINLIEYNNVSGINFKKAKKEKLYYFENFLLKNNVSVSIRRSRGEDIDAACGQLANKR